MVYTESSISYKIVGKYQLHKQVELGLKSNNQSQRSKFFSSFCNRTISCTDFKLRNDGSIPLTIILCEVKAFTSSTPETTVVIISGYLFNGQTHYAVLITLMCGQRGDTFELILSPQYQNILLFFHNLIEYEKQMVSLFNQPSKSIVY